MDDNELIDFVDDPLRDAEPIVAQTVQRRTLEMRLVDWSKGRIRDERAADYLLFSLAALFFAGTAFLLYVAFTVPHREPGRTMVPQGLVQPRGFPVDA